MSAFAAALLTVVLLAYTWLLSFSFTLVFRKLTELEERVGRIETAAARRLADLARKEPMSEVERRAQRPGRETERWR